MRCARKDKGGGIWSDFMLRSSYTLHQEKRGALGGTRIIILCLELGLIWLIYLSFGYLAAFELPLWLSTGLLIFVDRATSAITSSANAYRDRLY